MSEQYLVLFFLKFFFHWISSQSDPSDLTCSIFFRLFLQVSIKKCWVGECHVTVHSLFSPSHSQVSSFQSKKNTPEWSLKPIFSIAQYFPSSSFQLKSKKNTRKWFLQSRILTVQFFLVVVKILFVSFSIYAQTGGEKSFQKSRVFHTKSSRFLASFTVLSDCKVTYCLLFNLKRTLSWSVNWKLGGK